MVKDTLVPMLIGQLEKVTNFCSMEMNLFTAPRQRWIIQKYCLRFDGRSEYCKSNEGSI